MKEEKSMGVELPLPNFTGHDYSDLIGEFLEHDKLLESDISKLNCSEEFQLDRTLNSFNDSELNDHIYHIFYSKKN